MKQLVTLSLSVKVKICGFMNIFNNSESKYFKMALSSNIFLYSKRNIFPG